VTKSSWVKSIRLSSIRPASSTSPGRGRSWSDTSRVRVTALLSRSEVARISEPHAEMRTAGVIIAERTESAPGKVSIDRILVVSARVSTKLRDADLTR